jgi:hypothetical protein
MPETVATIRVTLPDGSFRDVAAGTTPLAVAAAIGPRLAKDAVVASVDGSLVDLATPIAQDATLRILTSKDPDALAVLRHSTAHATAQAVQELFPGTKIGQGPVIEGGFYYDFDRPEPFSDSDLETIEARMREIVARNLPIERITLPKDEAVAFLKNHKGDNIRRIIERAKEFIAANPMDKAQFRLAGGLIGVLAAGNEEILRNDLLMNFLGFSTMYVLILFTYRSWMAGIYMLIPLFLSNIAINAYMGLAGIGINVATLPVVTVGLGFGIDYGLYIVSRVIEEFQISGDLEGVTQPGQDVERWNRAWRAATDYDLHWRRGRRGNGLAL